MLSRFVGRLKNKQKKTPRIPLRYKYYVKVEEDVIFERASSDQISFSPMVQYMVVRRFLSRGKTQHRIWTNQDTITHSPDGITIHTVLVLVGQLPIMLNDHFLQIILIFHFLD